MDDKIFVVAAVFFALRNTEHAVRAKQILINELIPQVLLLYTNAFKQ